MGASAWWAVAVGRGGGVGRRGLSWVLWRDGCVWLVRLWAGGSVCAVSVPGLPAVPHPVVPAPLSVLRVPFLPDPPPFTLRIVWRMVLRVG